MTLHHRSCECERCHYCNNWLAARHDHDHFPIPTCCGGTETVPACLNCHELKDRMPLVHWPIDLYYAGLRELMDRGMRSPDLPTAFEQLGDVIADWSTIGMPARLLYAKMRFTDASERDLYPSTLF